MSLNWNIRHIRHFKKKQENRFLQMLTCYDYPTAHMLSQTSVDLILVGDSLGNVVLGYDTTIPVTLEDMILFGSAVTRGAGEKFVIVDMPFGTYSTIEEGLKNAIHLFQKTKASAIKLEGAYPYQLELIQRLTQNGIPVMGHIGLTPQSVHQMGGYYIHGKNAESASLILQQALQLEKAGAFALVLECVEKELAYNITQTLNIPTIGIGSGSMVDGQVLVLNDLLGLNPQKPPAFCQPIAQLYQQKKELVQKYLDSFNTSKIIQISSHEN